MSPETLFRVIGDGLSIASLSLIASMASTAWKRIPADATIPMQWNGQGGVTWRTSKTVGLLFTPVLATILLLMPTVFGATWEPLGPTAIVTVFAVRAIAAAVFAGAQMYHLREVYRTLEEEGVPLA